MKDGRPTASRNPRGVADARGRLSPERARAPLAALGLVLLAGAAGYYLIFAAFGTPMRIMLAVGILLVGIAIAIDPEAVWGRLTTRGSLYGGNTLALAALFLGVLGLLNVLGSRRHERWDLTASKQYSLSDETIKVLGQIEQPIQATAFFSNEQADATRKNEFSDLLREYQVRSNGKIDFEFVDPVERPGLAQQFGVREFGTTVLVMGDRRQQITGTRESDVTTAILRLLNPQGKKAYFTTGHNEHRLDSFDNDGYSQLKTSMESSNFVVEPLNLFATNAVPEDASLVVIGGPKLPFADEERQAISDYLNRGGKAMILADPRVEAGLGALLSPWNVELGQAYVVETDPAAIAFQSPFNPIVTKFPVHKVAEQLPSLLLPATTYINVPRDARGSTVITSLAQTSERSWAESDDAAIRDPRAIRFDEGADVRGPLTLAAAIEVRPDTAPGAEAASGPKTRLVVVGSSRFVANQVFQLPVGNRDFFLNAANWLAEAEELISIRAKPTDNRTLFLTSAQQNTILYSTTLFLPLLVLGLGAAVWWGRR